MTIVNLLLLFLLLGGCAYNVRELATFETVGVDPTSTTYSGVPLQNGQIVVTEKGSATGMLVSLFAMEYADFGHSGIVAIEDGKAYVYEALATVWPHLSGPVTHAMSGKVHRTPLKTFLSRHRIIAVYDPPPSVDRGLFASYARQQYDEKRAFDPYFNANDDLNVYCNELVAEALEYAGRPPVHMTLTTRHPSINRFLQWLAIDTDGFILARDLLDGATRRVLLSQQLTSSQIAAHIELRRELHRRFSNDQRPGNLFSWSATGPRFRPAVVRYLGGGMQNAAKEPVDAIPDFVDRWTAQNFKEADTHLQMARSRAIVVGQ